MTIEHEEAIDFSRLVKHNHQMLLRIVQRIVDEDASEEVVQEAWISIFKNISRFKGESTMKTWMCRIATNKALSYLRKKHSFKERTISGGSAFYEIENLIQIEKISEADSFLKVHTDNSPENILMSRELHVCIEKVLSVLPEKQRISFYLCYFAGESHDHICATLDISVSNVKVLIHRARIKLIDHIAEFQETGRCLSD